MSLPPSQALGPCQSLVHRTLAAPPGRQQNRDLPHLRSAGGATCLPLREAEDVGHLQRKEQSYGTRKGQAMGASFSLTTGGLPRHLVLPHARCTQAALSTCTPEVLVSMVQSHNHHFPNTEEHSSDQPGTRTKSRLKRGRAIRPSSPQLA